jgi:hypothetical protein
MAYHLILKYSIKTDTVIALRYKFNGFKNGFYKSFIAVVPNYFGGDTAFS